MQNNVSTFRLKFLLMSNTKMSKITYEYFCAYRCNIKQKKNYPLVHNNNHKYKILKQHEKQSIHYYNYRFFSIGNNCH